MKYLRVKELIEELQKYDKEAVVIVTDEGKDHQYGIIDEQISMTDNAYFGNDMDCESFFKIKYDDDGDKCSEKFLNLGYF
jgi:hypothetical protein